MRLDPWFHRLLHPMLLALAAAVVAAGGTLPSGTPGTGRPLDRSVFAAGSCKEFAPTVGDSHRIVFLDAGHGGVDPGGVGVTESGESINEADITLAVELDTMSLLRAAGYAVVVSRTTSSTVLKMGPGDIEDGTLTLEGAIDEVVARDRCANLAHADALIGIYFDSGSGPGYAGCLTGYDTARPFATANARLAQLVQTDVLDAMNAKGWDIPDQGAVTDDELGSLVPSDDLSGPLTEDQANYDHLLLLGPRQPGYQPSPSDMPGVVVEPLYLTDPFEGSIAASETGQRVIAHALAQAVEQFLPPLRPWDQGVTNSPSR